MLYDEYDTLRKHGFIKPVPEYIAANLKFELRKYQREAFENFITHFESDTCPHPTQVLFHMATGSGKTLIMAGLILYLYKHGYRNFLFFVNLKNIVDKTRENFLNPQSTKYLFADEIILDGERVRINEVENFQYADDDAINICFSTTQGLHMTMNFAKESGMTPEDFTEHSVSENLNAGTAMSRRAQYQYGTFLPKNPQGGMSIGIGMGQSKGTASFIVPSYEVKATGEKVTIDGVDIEFQITPGTEAPAEMNAYFPQKKALWLAENCTGTLHNLYTLRGAEVRDGNAWAEYIMEAVSLYGDETEVVFQSHNWPHWGTENVKDYMINTAAVYKYINDETLTMINQGYTSTETGYRSLPQRGK